MLVNVRFSQSCSVLKLPVSIWVEISLVLKSLEKLGTHQVYPLEHAANHAAVPMHVL